MRSLWIPLLAVAALLGGSSLLASYATFSFPHPRAPHTRFVVDPRRGVRLAHDRQTLRQGASTISPQAVIDETRFHFGVMNPHSVGEHRFVIHNHGQGPLLLSDGGSGCKCTLAEIGRASVPPGESSEILLQWNTGSQALYKQHATIRTNDPRQPLIQLEVGGRVDTVVGVSRESITFPGLLPGQADSRTFLVYSARWSDLELVSLESSIGSLRCTSMPATGDDLQAAGAKSGVKLKVEVPEQIPVGEFAGTITVSVRSAGSDAPPMSAAIEVRGRKLGRYSLIGRNLDGSGLLQLGCVPRGETGSQRLILRVRDSQIPASESWRVETRPQFLNVSIQPRSDSETAGLFDVTVSVAPDAPPCAYLGQQTGEIVIQSQRPNDSGIRLRVEFAVMEP
jgi:hypothetical protein